MVLKFLIPILVIVVLVVAIRTLVPGKKKADPTQPETMSTEIDVYKRQGNAFVILDACNRKQVFYHV